MDFLLQLMAEMSCDGFLWETIVEMESDLVLRNLNFVGMWIDWCGFVFIVDGMDRSLISMKGLMP